jgi:hypothetical protein
MTGSMCSKMMAHLADLVHSVAGQRSGLELADAVQQCLFVFANHAQLYAGVHVVHGG